MPLPLKPIQAGDHVKLAELPAWIDVMPEETRAVLQRCLGRVYPVAEVDAQGLVVLDLRADAELKGALKDMRVEARYLRRVYRQE